jgi:DNA mismatch endonuclease (patch repair protein)
VSDVFSPEKRKEVMSSIRSKNSKAEKIVFAYLNKELIYYQKHYKRAVGTPDIALPRKKLAVFIDGDFWHGRNYQHRLKGRPEDDPWVLKIKRNIERDKEQERKLSENSWEILRIWESDINRKSTRTEVLFSIKNFLANVQA